MILNIYRHLFDAGIRPIADVGDSSVASSRGWPDKLIEKVHTSGIKKTASY